jgi:hypothetical protein
MSENDDKEGTMTEPMWTNSGDSHFPEPRSLYRDNLPAALADRLPRSAASDLAPL